VLSYSVRSKISVKQTLEELAWDQVVEGSLQPNSDLAKAD